MFCDNYVGLLNRVNQKDGIKPGKGDSLDTNKDSGYVLLVHSAFQGLPDHNIWSAFYS